MRAKAGLQSGEAALVPGRGWRCRSDRLVVTQDLEILDLLKAKWVIASPFQGALVNTVAAMFESLYRLNIPL
jgi:hypothetical protein